MAARIVYSIKATTKLMQRNAKQLADKELDSGGNLGLYEGTLRDIIPNADVVVIQDLHAGFRRRPGEYILLVEVTQDGHTSPAVVKLNSDAENSPKSSPAGHNANHRD